MLLEEILSALSKEEREVLAKALQSSCSSISSGDFNSIEILHKSRKAEPESSAWFSVSFAPSNSVKSIILNSLRKSM